MSLITLNARAENGSSSEVLRSPIGSPSAVYGFDRRHVVGAGRKSTTASRTCCTPLFLYDEPQSTGVKAEFNVPLRNAARKMFAGWHGAMGEKCFHRFVVLLETGYQPIPCETE